MPQRIHWRRKPGQSIPPNTVFIDTRSVFGNPFHDRDLWPDADRRVELFQNYFDKAQAIRANPPTVEEVMPGSGVFWPVTLSELGKRGQKMLDRLNELRGKDLACTCKEDEPCHVDILLKAANAPEIS